MAATIRADRLAPPARVTVQQVRTVAGLEALQPDYERLQQSTGNTLPFSLHEWHLTWCRHFLNLDPRIHDQPIFQVLRNEAQVCVGVIPLIASLRRIGPLRIVSVNLLGNDPAITEISTPLVEPDYEYSGAQSVQESLSRSGDWDWIHWSGISSSFAAALAPSGAVLWQPALLNHVLDLAPTWDEFRARLKRNIKESLRHCYNSLKRHGHQFELSVATTPAEVRAGVHRFLELHSLRASLSRTVEHPNHFASGVSQRFLFEVCERLAARGAVRLFQLKIGAQIVAARIGFVVGDSLYLYYSGFDPDWARYSVMTTTLAEAIKYAIGLKLKTISLSPGVDNSKTRWGPRQVEYLCAYEHSGRLRSRLARRAYLKARSGNGLPARLLQRLIPAGRTWI